MRIVDGDLMNTNDVHARLAAALSSAQSGNLTETVRTLQTTLEALEDDRAELLTTTQAAEALGIGSINTVKSWVKTGYLTGVMRGTRTLIPRSEIARIHDSERAQRIRVAEHYHDLSADLGGDEPLSQDELDALDAGRPGTLPWERDPAQRRPA